MKYINTSYVLFVRTKQRNINTLSFFEINLQQNISYKQQYIIDIINERNHF